MIASMRRQVEHWQRQLGNDVVSNIRRVLLTEPPSVDVVAAAQVYSISTEVLAAFAFGRIIFFEAVGAVGADKALGEYADHA